MIKNSKILAATAVLTTIAVPAIANAQTFNSENGIKLFSGSLMDLLNNVISVALVLIGVIAVIYLIYGGIIYVTAGGDSDKAGKGRIAITNAIIGIIIVAASFVIYNAVANFGGGSDAKESLDEDFSNQ